jgi:hypothetical protein
MFLEEPAASIFRIEDTFVYAEGGGFMFYQNVGTHPLESTVV